RAGERRRRRAAPGGPHWPAQRGQVQPAEPAGRGTAGAGARGRRDHQGSRGRADRTWRGDLAVRGHGGGTPAGPGKTRGGPPSPAGRPAAPRGRPLRPGGALERAEVAVVLVDASEPLAEQDLRIVSMVIDAGRALVLAFNKWDLVDEDRRLRLDRDIDRQLHTARWAPRVNISAATGRHIDRLVPALELA